MQNYWQQTFDGSMSTASLWQACSRGKFGLDQPSSEALAVDLGCDWGPVGPPDLPSDQCAQNIVDPTGKTSTTVFSLYTNKLLAILQSKEFDLPSYRYLWFGFPAEGDCGWDGLATVGGQIMWTNGFQFDPLLVLHEGGHDLGFSHARTVTASTSNNAYTYSTLGPSAPSTCCEGLSRMGGGQNCYNLVEQYLLTWDDPVEMMLSEFMTGRTVVRAMQDYTTTSTSGWRLELANADGNWLYVSYASNYNWYNPVADDQNDRVNIHLSSAVRGGYSYSGTLRVAHLAPGEFFTYNDWTIVFHQGIPDSGTSIVSICREDPNQPCSKNSTQVLALWGGTAEVGVLYSGATVGGPVAAGDTDACSNAAFAAGYAAWSLDAVKRQCWFKASTGYTKTSRSGWVSGSSITAPPSPPPPPPPPPPPQAPVGAVLMNYTWGWFNGPFALHKYYKVGNPAPESCAVLCDQTPGEASLDFVLRQNPVLSMRPCIVVPLRNTCYLDSMSPPRLSLQDAHTLPPTRTVISRW